MFVSKSKILAPSSFWFELIKLVGKLASPRPASLPTAELPTHRANHRIIAGDTLLAEAHPPHDLRLNWHIAT